mgnify:FL=1
MASHRAFSYFNNVQALKEAKSLKELSITGCKLKTSGKIEHFFGIVT